MKPWWDGIPTRTTDGLIKTEAIEDAAREIAAKFDPERIILFGSYAYGEPPPDSDVDVLVVLDSPKGSRASLDILRTVDRDIPLEVIVRTPSFLSFRLTDGDCFLQEITTKGKELYARGHN